MAAKGAAKRVQQALDALVLEVEPLAQLAAARRLREAAEELERTKVQELRQDHTSWSKIGGLYGMSKQAAQQRFGTPSKAAPPKA